MATHPRAITAYVLAAGLALAPVAGQAREWHGGGWHGRGYDHHGGGNVAGAAVVGGLIGLGIGAAIANSNGPYYGPPAYYAPPPAVYYGY